MKMATWLQKINKFRASSSFVLLCAALLSGCGDVNVAGVGSGGTGSGPATTFLLAGRVADGYLINAIIFLDKNNNYRLDEGEPFAITGDQGAYKLDVAAADVGKYPLVVLALRGATIDMDDNLPVKNSYILSMSKESVHAVAENFISPISSQLREMMETGKYASMEQAAEVLRIKMGLPPGTNMLQDYVAQKNRTIHVVAQNMTALLASQMEQALTKDGTVDVNLYRGIMSALNEAIPLLGDASAESK